MTEGVHPFFQQTLLQVLLTRIRAYATRTSSMSRPQIESLLVYRDEPSSAQPPAAEAAAAAGSAATAATATVVTPVVAPSESQVVAEPVDEVSQPAKQPKLHQPKPKQEPAVAKQEAPEAALEAKPEVSELFYAVESFFSEKLDFRR